jgi:methylmalonyl-CoA mutase cobalamin-binding subunit
MFLSNNHSVADSYSIRLAARMTGISPHTLRMWERRYGFPAPGRTDGGARRYSGGDVERLKLIARALELGFRAGEAVPRDAEALERAIAEQVGAASPAPGATIDIEDVVQAAQRDDVDTVRTLVKRAAALLGPDGFVQSFAYPLCVKIGDLWHAGEVGVHQEHFVSEQLESQLRIIIDAYAEGAGAPRVLLATLPNQLHGLGIQMAALQLAVRGAKPRVLGVNSPVAAIAEAASAHRVDVVGVSVTGGEELAAQRKQLRRLRKLVPESRELWVGGRDAAQLKWRDATVHTIGDLDGLDGALRAWRAAR